MGRNANGLMKSSGDSGELTVGQLGQYKEGLLHNGGLASDIVRSYAVQRANRMLVHQIVKHLKKINNG